MFFVLGLIGVGIYTIGAARPRQILVKIQIVLGVVLL